MIRKMLVPKHYFKSITSWVLANYTAQSFQDVNGFKFAIFHESGVCEITWLNDCNFICHQTSGSFGDYFRTSRNPSVATDLSIILDYVFINETEAEKWLAKVKDVQIGGTSNVLLTDVLDKVRCGQHVYVLFQGLLPASSTLLIDVNDNIAPTAEKCPYIRGRAFKSDLLR